MSDCASACIYSQGGDPSEYGPTISNTVEIKARKQHRCCECQEPILAGTVYERIRGLWDGSWSEYKTCLACSEIRHTFCCEGWTYGTLWNDAREGFFESVGLGCIDKLQTAAAKQKLTEQWRKYRGIPGEASGDAPVPAPAPASGP